MSGAGLDAEAQGTAEPWAAEPRASVNLAIRSVNLAPLFGLKPSDAQNIALSSQVSLLGNRLSFDGLDSTISGSRLRGHLALSLDDDKNVDGEIGLDTLSLAPAFALAIGAAGHDAAEPLNAGLIKGWRGRVVFQALRGSLPGGGELQPVSGTVRSDGQSLTFEDIKGKIGGGEVIVNMDARQDAGGIALNARAQFVGVDGRALRYRALAMPAGRVSMQATLASQGRSASALIGALSGSGTVTLESAKVAGLDPRAFEIAVRASDDGQATDDVKLRQIVEPALSAGALSVASAQIPFTIRDGRMRIGATPLDAPGVRAVVSGGYDIPADQADIRAALGLTMALPATGRPEIQLFAVGTPDGLSRTVDVTALSSWLAVRKIDHETRRLDAIERGEPPPPPPAPVSLPPQEEPPPSAVLPGAGLPSEPLSQVPLPGRDPRRLLPKAKAVVPRPPAAPPVANAPGSVGPSPNVSSPNGSNAHAPVVSQQVTPLPPPIDVKPAPGSVRPKPRPQAPLVLTPPVAAPAR
jgi:large subunit ribosomal protein L24